MPVGPGGNRIIGTQHHAAQRVADARILEDGFHAVGAENAVAQFKHHVTLRQIRPDQLINVACDDTA